MRVRSTPAGSALAIASVITAMTLTSAFVPSPEDESDSLVEEAPNVVFILVDDADTKTLDYMPFTRALVADEGATFDNFFYQQALCCPSRATILRGQYSQNTGVSSNVLPNGGYGAFYNNGDEVSTLGTWFHDADYSTAYLGKYFNGYAGDAGLPDTHVPVGWDHWFGLFDDSWDSYDYTVNEDGVLTHRGSQPRDHVSDVLSSDAQHFLRSDLAEDPFFMEIATKAPHGLSIPAPRHKGLFGDVPYPQSPSFNEADMSDKPEPMQTLPPLDADDIREITRNYRLRLRSLQAVDEMVAAIVGTLERQGELENTYIAFASDNGFHMGEHRLPEGKDTQYEEDIRVPLFLRGPGIAAGQHVDELVGNVDIAPTFADAAGIEPPSWVDGRSLLPLVTGQDVPWRTQYQLSRGDRRLGMVGLRTPTYVYVEHHSGGGEFYDLVNDPYELDNLFDSMPVETREALHARARALHKCSGQRCRNIEERAVPPFDGAEGWASPDLGQ